MTTEILEKPEYTKVPREDLVAALVERDGTKCMFPGCGAELNFNAVGPREVTLDHWVPQWFGKENGWTMDQIWAVDNLKLMEKKCNAKKGDRLPNADGTLPHREESTFKFRRMKRAQRPEICTSCNAGRFLGEGEWCNACGTGGATEWWKQKWRQMKVTECDHDLFYCVSCTIWFPESRRSALDALITGGNGYE